METRASYIIVGGFVIALVAGILVFALWIGGTETAEKTKFYHVDFTGEVTGLREGASVLYRGIPIGEVTEIGIDPIDHHILTIIEVRDDTPVTVDTQVVLEQGILTGVAYLQLKGGTPGSPPLEPEPGQDMAVIYAGQSTFQELTESAPELMAQASELVRRAQNLLSPENIDQISGILEDVRTLTTSFASESGNINRFFLNLELTMASLTTAMDEVAQLSNELRAIAEEQGKQITPAVDEAKRAAAAFTELADSLDTIVEENKRAFTDFASTGLYELTRFLTEARTLVAALQRLTERIERDPARFLFGDSQKGVQVK